MRGISKALRQHAWLAAAIIAAALALRILIPAGHMPSMEHKRFTIAICTVHAAGEAEAPYHLDIPFEKEGAGTTGCAFADLALSVIGGADPFILALAIAFVLALWLRGSAPLLLQKHIWLRPPLRGPPHI